MHLSAYDFPQRLAERAARSSNATMVLLTISGLAILGLVFIAALWAGKESDSAALDRQRKLVDSRLQDQVDRVSKDLRLMAAGYSTLLSASASTSELGGASTAQAFATMSKTVFGYNGTFLITPAGDLAIASDAETTRRYKWIRPLLLPMVKTVSHGQGLERGKEAIRVDLMRLEGRPSIAGIALVDAPSKEASQRLLLAAFRFLDGPTLDTLSREQGLAGARYARTADAEAEEVAFQIEATATHEPIGFIIWTPDLPGSRVVARLTPLLTFAGVLIGGLFLALMLRLRKSLLELGHSEDHARHLSLHDVLTGLPNRALFSERFESCRSGLRHKNSRTLLALFDLDKFKEVNDTYGHPAGDELLCKVVARVEELLGGADTFARVGGDEFALIVPDMSERRDDELLSEIISALRAPFDLRAAGGVVVRIGCSIGAVHIEDMSIDRGEALRRADVALYEAKSSGRGKYVTYDRSLDSRGTEKESLTRELRQILTAKSNLSDNLKAESDAGELQLFFQSVHHAQRGEPISGAEALVRWQHPRFGLLSPDKFVPLAEEAGLIDQLGEWVLRTAAREATAWPENMSLAVNVSPSQIRHREFASRALSIITDTGLDPARLELEITEAALFEVDDKVQATLASLRSHGIRIALDDFGTGYSSLSHLLQINIDRIKIDRSFVKLLGNQADGAAIVSSVIGLSRKLGKAATAEGVETVGQRDFLIAAGCTDLQGYLYSRPLPSREFGATMLPSAAGRSLNRV